MNLETRVRMNKREWGQLLSLARRWSKFSFEDIEEHIEEVVWPNARDEGIPREEIEEYKRLLYREILEVRKQDREKKGSQWLP